MAKKEDLSRFLASLAGSKADKLSETILSPGLSIAASLDGEFLLPTSTPCLSLNRPNSAGLQARIVKPCWPIFLT
ncbi:hypothetical protein PGT21_032649 [Puccinia graminis f. sp. tritici]|uniref:Uncharacterized protein n=1 Tax=Puccinia graminis f. sp. tritici TaxID=56615 RepID=A0A5B0MZI3_PUCGR|nr:hypothetical protein PGT21_032649 [Puccinia graminis f. sp. tritici]KAA1130222.1 hypothetical protein PGTUg99_010826 [Puccinia graminis f. sp. tritici]